MIYVIHAIMCILTGGNQIQIGFGLLKVNVFSYDWYHLTFIFQVPYKKLMRTILYIYTWYQSRFNIWYQSPAYLVNNLQRWQRSSLRHNSKKDILHNVHRYLTDPTTTIGSVEWRSTCNRSTMNFSIHPSLFVKPVIWSSITSLFKSSSWSRLPKESC